MTYGREWFAAKKRGGWPLLVDEEDGNIAGFATYGTFRDWPAYHYSIEHSVYVHEAYRGRGIATTLMKELISLADEAGYAIIVAGIDGDNDSSIALHQKLGFRYVGTIEKAGYKFSRWLNLAFYQLNLTGPSHPEEH
jgi:phosphinothricin acetyltransferase